MEKNLIFAQSDYLRIFTFDDTNGSEKLVPRTEVNVNDKIVDIIRIPTDVFSQRAQFGGISDAAPFSKNSKARKHAGRQV